MAFVLGWARWPNYRAAVAGLAVLAFWCRRKAWRDPMHRFGLQVAGLTALAVFAPHLIWLIHHDFEPLGYAMSSSLAAGLPWSGRAHEVARWWGDQLLNRALPAWIFLRRSGSQAVESAARAPPRRPRTATRRARCCCRSA